MADISVLKNRTEINEGFSDGLRLVHIWKWGFAVKLSNSPRHWTVPSDWIILDFSTLTVWHDGSMQREARRQSRCTDEFPEDVQILLRFISASILGSAGRHSMALDKDWLCGSLSGIWGLDPDDSSTLSSLFSLFHWKCLTAGPFAPLMSERFLS